MATTDIPDWLESKLFENVLKDTVKDFKKILNFKVKRALPPGENYATIMLKIQIEVELNSGECQTKTFMMKVAHDTEFFRQEMKKFNIFTIESAMYHDIKPELENLYKEIGLEVQFGATSYKLPIDQEYILLEDLTKKDFRNANRLEGLNMEHCKSVLKKVAQWHAASAVRIERKGLYEDRFCKGVLNENGKKLMATMLETSFNHLIKAAKKLKNHEEYLEQIESLDGKITDLFYKGCAPNENDFNVLNHGDCWCNNIMFRYDENDRLLDTYLVDYQIPCYGTPAQDLLYFILTSAQLDIKINRFDYMIKYYHDNLVEQLTLLRYKKKMPTLKDIQQSLIKYSLWGKNRIIFAIYILNLSSSKQFLLKVSLQHILQCQLCWLTQIKMPHPIISLAALRKAISSRN